MDLKHVLSFFIISVCLSITLGAQNESSLSSIAQTIGAIYENLDGPYVTTGYLKDKAVDLIKLPAHKGQALTDSNYVDAFLFRDLFRTMNYARASSTATQYNPDNIFSSLTTSSNGYVKLQTALFKYNYIIEDAVEDSLITYNPSTGKVSYKEVAGVVQNPYDTEYVFMITAGQSMFDGTLVFYDTSNLAPIGNCSVGNNAIEIDFDDGEGYVSSFSQFKIVSYPTEGIKDVKARVTLQDNTVLVSHTYLQVYDSVQAAQMSGGGTVTVQPDDSFTVYNNGISAKCWYSLHAGPSGNAVKPFIYLEGFDHPVLAAFTDKNDPNWFKKLLGNPTDGNYDFYAVYKSIKALLDNSGYDFFYVNWNNPEADIKQNAVLLDSIITRINRLRPTDGSDYPGVLVGHSMGGLIARWGLRQMEIAGREHKVGCFISQDSPHLGAVVPIGAQYTLRDIYRCLFGADGNSGISNSQQLKTVIDKIVGVLDCTSARQMMYNYIDASGTLNNAVHNQWQADLSDNGFPKGDPGHPIENLAIVSGGDLGSEELSNSILSATLSLSSFLQLATYASFSNLFVSLKIDRDRGPGTEVSKTTVSYTHISSIDVPQVFLLKETSHCSTQVTGRYDMVRGSYIGVDDMPNFVIPLPSLFFSLFGNCKIVFVPMASALAYYSGYNTDWYSYPPNPNNCFFDSYCLEEDAMRHDNSLAAYVDWIIQQAKIILNGPEGLIFDGDSFSLSNAPSTLSFNWSSSDETIATVNNSGVVSFSNPGLIIIESSASNIKSFYYWVYHHTLLGLDSTYVEYPQKRLYRKARTVHAGFPDMILHASRQSGDLYNVTAAYASYGGELVPFMDNLAARGDLRFIWGYKNSDDSYTWVDTTSTRSYVCTALPNILTHVCMKLYYSPRDSTSRTINSVDIDRSTNNPFFAEPGNMTITPLWNTYDYSILIGTQASSNHYYGVWYNSEYSPSPSAPNNILIGNETILLETAFSKTIDGESKTVYCFDFMQSSIIQDFMDDPNVDECFVTIKIRNGVSVLQTELFHIEKMAHNFNPL